ncbi:MAG TPA: amidohydrolase family protein [Jatrophihabitans sp.]|jgi:predicted TIM-barrel fold metal-dependent hydrolase
MTIDGLAYLGTSRFGYELDAEALVKGLERERISGAIAAPMHRVDHDFDRANEHVAQAAAGSGGRLVPMARVDPWDGDQALRQLNRAVVELGARGLFLHPAEEYFRINDARVQPLARRAAELGIPIVVATGYQGFSEPVQITQFARACPEVPVILTNGGQFNISGLSQTDAGLALNLDNVYVHTSGVYRDDWIALVVSTFGAERILFASAAPIMDVRYELKRVELAHVPDEAKALMLSGNATRLFGLGGELA